jgi:PEP-CTERM motif
MKVATRTPLLVVVAAISILVPLQARAVIIPAYFGWNYALDAPGGGDPPAPPVAELTSITYTGGAGAGLVMPMPAFPTFVGMPDGPGFGGPPVFGTGGDGESTRSVGSKLPIDWVPAGAPAPYLPAPVPFPTIGISSFTVSAGGAPFGAYAGFPVVNNVGGPTPDYVVGLIPVGPDTELMSFLLGPQGDIYSAIPAPGNPTLPAANTFPLRTDVFTVTFAAAVPEPATIVLAAIAVLPLLVLARRRRRPA